MMTDSERLAAARKFFWEQAERAAPDRVFTPQEVDQYVNALARAIPPFTTPKVGGNDG